jgi:hypothetical protein
LEKNKERTKRVIPRAGTGEGSLHYLQIAGKPSRQADPPAHGSLMVWGHSGKLEVPKSAKPKS